MRFTLFSHFSKQGRFPGEITAPLPPPLSIPWRGASAGIICDLKEIPICRVDISALITALRPTGGGAEGAQCAERCCSSVSLRLYTLSNGAQRATIRLFTVALHKHTRLKFPCNPRLGPVRQTTARNTNTSSHRNGREKQIYTRWKQRVFE